MPSRRSKPNAKRPSNSLSRESKVVPVIDEQDIAATRDELGDWTKEETENFDPLMLSSKGVSVPRASSASPFWIPRLFRLGLPRSHSQYVPPITVDALRIMHAGTNFLVCSKRSNTYRVVSLAANNLTISWGGKSAVALTSITEVSLGQATETFRPALMPLALASFSIHYTEKRRGSLLQSSTKTTKTLDLIAPSSDELHVWTTAIPILIDKRKLFRHSYKSPSEITVLPVTIPDVPPEEQSFAQFLAKHAKIGIIGRKSQMMAPSSTTSLAAAHSEQPAGLLLAPHLVLPPEDDEPDRPYSNYASATTSVVDGDRAISGTNRGGASGLMDQGGITRAASGHLVDSGRIGGLLAPGLVSVSASARSSLRNPGTASPAVHVRSGSGGIPTPQRLLQHLRDRHQDEPRKSASSSGLRTREPVLPLYPESPDSSGSPSPARGAAKEGLVSLAAATKPMHHLYDQYPLSNGEATNVDVLYALRKGAKMVKFGRRGGGQLRDLWLSTARTHLCWSSAAKAYDQARIALADVTQIVFGQVFPNFQHNKAPQALALVSFSLVYRTETNHLKSLDLIAASRYEFEVWTEGLAQLLTLGRSRRWQHIADFESLVLLLPPNDPAQMDVAGVLVRKLYGRS